MKMELKELKERILKVQEICKNCNVMDGEIPCRDILISRKIGSGIGCGKWIEEGKHIINQEVYDSLRNLSTIKIILDDLMK